MLAQISKKHKIHLVYKKGKPTMTYCSMYLWNYIAKSGNIEKVTCSKCIEEYWKEAMKQAKKDNNI